MDKTVRCKTRNGFALIITLSVLSVMIALAGVLLSYLDEVREDAVQTKAMIQANLYYVDMQNAFKKLGKNKKSIMELLYSYPIPLNSPEGEFSVTVKCRPLANGININWLGLENNQTMEVFHTAARQVFDSIAQAYSIEDAGRLQELLLEEIGGAKKWVQKEQHRLVQKNGIISREQFERIITQYQFEADDAKVNDIPWEKFFVFDTGIEQMDGNYLSAELISLLFDFDIALVEEGWIVGETALQSFVESSGGEYAKYEKLFSKGFVDESECEVRFPYGNKKFGFTFMQSRGEIKYFEFDSK
ncbi:MAG: hypothetical protein QG564_636 [Campylobacterota bacterium]|nr:hypothetical protein [Campylobacterota bacterium]